MGATTAYKKKCYDIATLLCMLATCMSAVNLSLELLLDAPTYYKITSIAIIVVMLVGAIDSIREYIREIHSPHNLKVHVDIGNGPDKTGYYDKRSGKGYTLKNSKKGK